MKVFVHKLPDPDGFVDCPLCPGRIEIGEGGGKCPTCLTLVELDIPGPRPKTRKEGI